jgi:hypothetical protein
LTRSSGMRHDRGDPVQPEGSTGLSSVGSLRQALEAPAGCPGIPSPWGTTGYSWDPA